MAMRNRNAAVLVKIEAAPGTFLAPSAATDGVLVEAPNTGFNPQNIDTNEVTGSLDGRGPLIGGIQVTYGFSVYLKGQGTPGNSPQFANLLKICGFAESLTQTIQSGTTFSITGGNTINDSANGLAVNTVGTHLYLSSPANPYAELIVTASAAGALTVTKPDGSAPGLVNESAGGTFTMVRGIVGTAATAGTTISATLAAPYAATAQVYRGMPVLLSGNPATPAYAFISDYTAGRVATLTDQFGVALSATTKVSIPANALYTPTSAVIPTASIEYYLDGVRYRFKGCRGTVKFTFDAAGACKADFTISGMFDSKADAAVPAVTYDGTRPGMFRNSVMLLNRVATALGQVSIDMGNSLKFPDDPNQSEGFAPPEIIVRKMAGQMNPYSTLVATRDAMTDFRNGNAAIIHGRVLGGNSVRSGNRVGFTVPTGVYVDYEPGDDGGLATEEIGFFPQGQDSGMQLCIY